MNTLVIFTGLPGTGKSTACKMFIEKVKGFFFFDSDEFAKTSKHFEGVDFGKLSESEMFDLRYRFYSLKSEEVRKRLEQGSVVMDALFDKRAFRNVFYDVVKRLGARLIVIQISGAESIIKDRIMNDKKHRADSFSRWNIYLRTKKSFEKLGFFEKRKILYENIDCGENINNRLDLII